MTESNLPMPNPSFLETLKELYPKITQGEWFVLPLDQTGEAEIGGPDDYGVSLLYDSAGQRADGESVRAKDNAAFIVALVNAFPQILALGEEVERLRAENKSLRKALRPFASVADAIDYFIPEVMPWNEEGSVCFPRDGVKFQSGDLQHAADLQPHDFMNARAALNGGGA
mgnify:CR=1 FL=1